MRTSWPAVTASSDVPGSFQPISKIEDLIQHHFENCYLVPGGFSLFVVFPDIVMVFLVAPSLVTTVFFFLFSASQNSISIFTFSPSVVRQSHKKGHFGPKLAFFGATGRPEEAQN